MRLLLVIGLVAATRTPDARACQLGSRTYLASGELFQVTALPAHPSLFVHAGWDVSPDLLEVTRPSGASVPFTRTPSNDPGWTRVDLDVVRGFLIVRIPGTERSWWFVVDPAFHPATRAVEVNDRDGSLQLDSDAPMLRCEGGTSESELLEWWSWRRRDAGDQCERVVAMYADRTEEVIFVRSAYARRPRWRERGYLLVMALGALVAVGRANRHERLHAS